MPCSDAVLPVSIVAWAEQVTAGTTSRNEHCQPARARAWNRGARGKCRAVKPTVLTRTSMNYDMVWIVRRDLCGVRRPSPLWILDVLARFQTRVLIFVPHPKPHSKRTHDV